MSDNASLKVEEFYQYDPLFRWLLFRLHLSKVFLIVVFVALTLVVLLGLPVLVSTPLDAQNLTTIWLQTLIIFPIGLGIFLTLPEAMVEMFNKLAQGGVITAASESGSAAHTVFQHQLLNRANNRWWSIIALVTDRSLKFLGENEIGRVHWADDRDASVDPRIGK